MGRIVLRTGISEPVLGYAIEGERVLLRRPGGAVEEVALEDIDTAATFAANAEPVGAPDPPLLELLARREQALGAYRMLEGSVRNVSGGELVSVVARALCEDESGRLLGAEEALVDPSPLAAGGEGTFRLIVRPAAPSGRTRLAFRRLQGAAILHREEGTPEDGPGPAGAG